ncbi:MAG TPA: hypothetical protein VFX02_09120 [Gammaproteobacteria bacterium]|nr:hypothetical protein [Gammaproteobacteria bacterium]
MKKLLHIWFALSLALNPVAGAVASAMPMPEKSKTESHCPGHASHANQAQPMPRDCCRPGHLPRQCCDHCAGVGTSPALMNTVAAVFLNHAIEPIVAPARMAPSASNSPPYRPPQA